MPKFIICCLLAARLTAALSDAPHNFNSQYMFSQQISLDASLLTGDDMDESSESILTEKESEDPSIVESSLMYSGGFQVSAQAMMISGGEAFSGDASLFMEFDDENASDDEDDEDDDDDGHSSMLSNASLRRTRVSANGVAAGSSITTEPEGSDSTSQSQTPLASSFLQNKALAVRGGGSSIGTEYAKRLLVAAIVTLAYEAIIGHFLEFVKIVMQTSRPGTSYGDVLRLITKEKGFTGIWDGFVPWGVVQAVFKGGVFGLAHAISSSFLTPLAEKKLIPQELALTLAGGIGGGFQGFVLSPTLLLKTRVMTNPVFREKMSMLRTTLLSMQIGFEVVKTEGLGALMKGSGVFATKRVFDWATRFYFSDMFEKLIAASKGSDLSPSEKICASLLGGTASTISTLPLDVLVAKTQDAKKAGVKVSPIKMFMDDVEKYGWVGVRNNYLRGFEARLAHVCFTTVAMKTVAPLVYDAIFKS